MSRQADLSRLYSLLALLRNRVDGPNYLANCNGRMDWPERGIYIFLSANETWQSTDHQRITRVGTHAVSRGSGTSLWNRLISHRGTFSGKYAGGGDHRGSVFRLRVGEAMAEREGLHDEFPEWGDGTSAGSELRNDELEHERRVSDHIRSLPFLWVAVDDEPGPESRRAELEQNIIALASSYQTSSVDPRDSDWLGKHSPNQLIRESGLWNVDHVMKNHDSSFLDLLETHIEKTTPA